MDIFRIKGLGLVASTCLLLAACGGGDGGGSSNAGKLSLSITDAPVYSADAVEVDFNGVEIKPESASALQFSFCEDPADPVNDPPVVVEGECSATDPTFVTIDLLQQTGGASYLLLDQVELPAGRVDWVRLKLEDPAGRFYEAGGTEHPLSVPSGNQTGLKLNRGFDVPVDGEVEIYIDFDVRKSIVMAATGYKLKPSLRLVEEFGAIAGEVDAGLLPTTCLGPSVYVFAGAGATPDDIDGDKGDPFSSAMVKEDMDSTTGYSYRADFLDPGEYTVAFVCAEGVSPLVAPADDPERDDALDFTPPAGKPATVVNGQTFGVDF